jgi:hypothetical protein
MTRYRFVEAESGRYSVAQLCRIAKVSRTAYYEWQGRSVSERARVDAELTAKIRAIHAASGGQYGVPRVLAELRAQGYHVGRKRVARLMKAAGLRGRRPPRWVRTTTPEPTPPAIPDRVHGQFEAPAPDGLWVGDITYVRTWEGWLYLATVIDVFSRRVLGFALADHMRASLVCDALEMAVATRGGHITGVIFHSDRGSQGGFNRSSQHLKTEVLYGKATWVDGDAYGAAGDAVAGPTAGAARCGAGVLGEDRRGTVERGGGDRVWCVRPGRCSLVPRAGWHAIDPAHPAVGEVPVVR